MKPLRSQLPLLTVALCVGLSAYSPAGDDCVGFYSSGWTLRGDANNDTLVDISDVIFLYDFLYLQGASEPPCDRDSADVNDDGTLNVTDPITLSDFLFLSGPPPAEPFPFVDCDCSPDDVDVCASPPSTIGPFPWDIPIANVVMSVTWDGEPVPSGPWDFADTDIAGDGRLIRLSVENGECHGKWDEFPLIETEANWEVTWFVNDAVGITQRGNKQCQQVHFDISEHLQVAVDTICHDCPLDPNQFYMKLKDDSIRFGFRNALTGSLTYLRPSSGGIFGWDWGPEEYSLIQVPGPPPNCDLQSPTQWSVADNDTTKLQGGFPIGAPCSDRYFLEEVVYGFQNAFLQYWSRYISPTGWQDYDLTLGEIIKGASPSNLTHSVTRLDYSD